MQRLQDSDSLLIQSICKSWVMKLGIWNHWIELFTLFNIFTCNLNYCYLIVSLIVYTIHVLWATARKKVI